MVTVETDPPTLRPPVEGDRARFVELFTNEAFMVFAVLDSVAANARFDRMLAVAKTIPYGKQPFIDRVNGSVVGYTGVDTVELDGLVRLEWGWRFVPDRSRWPTAPRARCGVVIRRRAAAGVGCRGGRAATRPEPAIPIGLDRIRRWSAGGRQHDR